MTAGFEGDGVDEDGMEGRGPARAAPRDSLLLLTELRNGKGVALGKARIRNLSATGMMIETDAPLVKDQDLQFELRGVGAISGCVAWVRADRIGVVFDEAIDPQRTRKPVGQGAGTHDVPTHLRVAGRFSRAR